MITIEEHCGAEIPYNQCAFCPRTNTAKHPFYTCDSPKVGFGLSLCPKHLQEQIARSTRGNDGVTHCSFMLKRPEHHKN